MWQSLVVVPVDAGSDLAAAASSPVNKSVCNVITRASLSVLHTVNPVGLIIKFNHTLMHNTATQRKKHQVNLN